MNFSPLKTVLQRLLLIVLFAGATAAQAQAQSLKISEFRLSGPGGSADEFIEIYNNSNAPFDAANWSVGSAAARATIPANKVLPAYGRLLVTGTAYSLNDYGGAGLAAGDVNLSGDIAAGSVLELRDGNGAVIDSVNPANLPSPLAFTDNYSYVRRMDGVGGAPLDTDNDFNDFNLVDVQSTVGPNNTTGISNGVLRLGAPGPKNLSSAIVDNTTISCVPASPPTLRTGTGNSGTFAVRYVLTNRAERDRAITALRFRIVGLTAGTTAMPNSGPADLRLISSQSSDGTILPLILQNPPAQPNGGGLNSSVSLAGLPGGGLVTGASITFEMLFQVMQSGTYRFLLNAEPVLGAPAPITHGVDAVVGVGTALVGANVFYPDEQISSAGGSPNTTTAFRLIVNNTGNVQDTLRLSGRGDTPGWKVRYFDAPSGGNDISAAVKGNNYLVLVSSHFSRELRIEVTPDASVAQNQTKDVPVSARSETDSLYSDQVTARVVQNGAQPTPTPAAYSVDASIRLASAQNYSGVGVFSPQTPDASQTVSATASSDTAAVYNWRVQNKSSASDSFKLTLPATPAGWTVRLFTTLDSSTDEIDITSAAQSAAGYLTASLSPDAFFEMRLTVQPASGTSGTITTNLSAASVGDSLKTDVCAANTSSGTVTSKPVVTFAATAGTTRACAGGIDNALHKVTLMLSATQNGTVLPNTTFQLSFENNVGHNYGTDTNPDIRRRTKIFDPTDPNNPWKETLTVTTNAQGQVPVTVLSSDVISQPRLIAGWTNAGDTSTVGGVKFDFAEVTSLRGFPDPVIDTYPNWQNDDTGWTCDFGAVEDEGATTVAKLFVKFERSPGDFQPVAGHQVKIKVGRINVADGARIYDEDETGNYVVFLDGATEVTTMTVTTDSSGIAQVTLKGKSNIAIANSIELIAQNGTQWLN